MERAAHEDYLSCFCGLKKAFNESLRQSADFLCPQRCRLDNDIRVEKTFLRLVRSNESFNWVYIHAVAVVKAKPNLRPKLEHIQTQHKWSLMTCHWRYGAHHRKLKLYNRWIFNFILLSKVQQRRLIEPTTTAINFTSAKACFTFMIVFCLRRRCFHQVKCASEMWCEIDALRSLVSCRLSSASSAAPQRERKTFNSNKVSHVWCWALFVSGNRV